jgi:hypothetical protein
MKEHLASSRGIKKRLETFIRIAFLEFHSEYLYASIDLPFSGNYYIQNESERALQKVAIFKLYSN